MNFWKEIQHALNGLLRKNLIIISEIWPAEYLCLKTKRKKPSCTGNQSSITEKKRSPFIFRVHERTKGKIEITGENSINCLCRTRNVVNTFASTEQRVQGRKCALGTSSLDALTCLRAENC